MLCGTAHQTKANSQTGQLLQNTLFLARPPVPATAGISGGLSASQLSLQLPMSFRKKLFTSFGCISDRNTSSLPTYTYYSILVTYTYPPFDFLPYLSQTFFGLKEFLITLWFWPIPFQPSPCFFPFDFRRLQRKLQNWNLSKYCLKNTFHDALAEWTQDFNLLKIS